MKAYAEVAGAGVRPNFMAVGGWDGMRLIYEVAKKLEGDRSTREQGHGGREGPDHPQPARRRSRSIPRRATSCRLSTSARSQKVDGEILQRRVRQVPEGEGSGQDVAGAIDGIRRLRRHPLRRHRVREPAVPHQRGPVGDMGLMNFVNLAHGAFAMMGGYAVRRADATRWALSFLDAAGRSSSACAVVGAVLERAALPAPVRAAVLWTRCCSPSASRSWRSPSPPTCGARRSSRCALPAFLRGQVQLARARPRRLPPVPDRAGGWSLTAALACSCERTRFGAQLRAAVDNRQRAAGVGIHVDRVFSLTSRSGPGWRGSAARWASTCSGSTRRSRSSTWCTSCSWWWWAAPGTIQGPLVAARRCSASSTWRASTTCRRLGRLHHLRG